MRSPYLFSVFQAGLVSFAVACANNSSSNEGGGGESGMAGSSNGGNGGAGLSGGTAGTSAGGTAGSAGSAAGGSSGSSMGGAAGASAGGAAGSTAGAAGTGGGGAAGAAGMGGMAGADSPGEFVVLHHTQDLFSNANGDVVAAEPRGDIFVLAPDVGAQKTSPDETRIVFTDFNSPKALKTIDLTDGTYDPSVLASTTGSAPTGDFFFSPDGNHVAYSVTNGARDVEVVSIDGSSTANVEPAASTYQWATNDYLVISKNLGPGDTRFEYVHRDGTSRMMPPTADVHAFSVGPNGNVAYTADEDTGASGNELIVTTPSGTKTTLYSSTASATDIFWSPDSNWLVWNDTVFAADGSGMTTLPDCAQSVRFSLDVTRLAAYCNRRLSLGNSDGTGSTEVGRAAGIDNYFFNAAGDYLIYQDETDPHVEGVPIGGGTPATLFQLLAGTIFNFQPHFGGDAFGVQARNPNDVFVEPATSNTGPGGTVGPGFTTGETAPLSDFSKMVDADETHILGLHPGATIEQKDLNYSRVVVAIEYIVKDSAGDRIASYFCAYNEEGPNVRRAACFSGRPRIGDALIANLLVRAIRSKPISSAP